MDEAIFKAYGLAEASGRISSDALKNIHYGSPNWERTILCCPFSSKSSITTLT